MIHAFRHEYSRTPLWGTAGGGHRIVTVRWRLFQVPGRVIRHAGAWVLKVATTFAADFADIRARGYATLHELAP
ncbi:hypothetical protein [Acidithiobacillus sulfuriphilus]|uniref:Uncharacterized protein n=1 Tax=Acidithiobacillus sulfuriphilus TaxID=1867749 RepID=A0ACD5HRH4_9PROT|nr:hypothetical protein [Acidithiobacillus sulfuriphilus]